MSDMARRLGQVRMVVADRQIGDQIEEQWRSVRGDPPNRLYKLNSWRATWAVT
jgi:hypothetical protein